MAINELAFVLTSMGTAQGQCLGRENLQIAPFLRPYEK